MDGKKRDGFATGLGSLLAMLGSAIGIGNVIKFPALTGTSGGGAFILVYIFCLLIAGIPVFVAELIVGRRGKANVVDAYTNVSGKKRWSAVGWFSAIGALVLLSYYTLFGSWLLRYSFTAGTGALNGIKDVTVAQGIFASFNTSIEPFLWQVGLLLIAGVVLSFGVKSGIEKAVKFLMPIFVAILLVTVIRGITMPGAMESVTFLLKPDFSKITIGVVLGALGLSFFKLSLGVGTMVTYGSYTNQKVSLLKNAFKVVSLDLLVSLLVGFAVFSGFFSGGNHGLAMAGFDLLFQTLPVLYADMFMGQWIMLAFFLLTSIVAFTAAISMIEVPIAVLTEKTKLSRRASTWIVIGVLLLASIIPGLSESVFTSFSSQNFVFTMGGLEVVGVVDFLDKIVSNIMMPLSGFFTVILVAYRMSYKDFSDELSNYGSLKNQRLIKVYRVIEKITPIFLLIIFIQMSGILSLILKPFGVSLD